MTPPDPKIKVEFEWNLVEQRWEFVSHFDGKVSHAIYITEAHKNSPEFGYTIK